MHTTVSATAVVLTSDGICVTNQHVIDGLLRSANSSNIDSVAFVGTVDGKVYSILEVLTYSKTADIAIFPN